ncbi:carbonic anhydrase [Mesobacillus persicus]|uniref:Carbonic anhydrase n=1 Tax=Mesobacillus persicus TaxID=930146 RepID=A0A1H7WMP5_9BACI|nr:carbonic anhydrase family protein [Mesobacillus persicus]SEM22405.1 carbonic anhydrase [Mesobacillus persicus]
MQNRVLSWRFLSISWICFAIIAFVFPFGNPHAASAAETIEWSYSGKTGPDYWGELDPAFVKCTKGTTQSPININPSESKESDQEEVVIRYNPTNYTVINNTHTIKIIPSNQINSLRIGDERYVQQELHFHYPSEHQLNNKEFPLELHLVHKNAKGDLAVIGLFAKEGEKNGLFQILTNYFPSTTGSEKEINETLDLTNLLPDEKEVYTYDGSLTVPPCTEGVKWIIFNKPIELSRQQIKKITDLHPANNRPLQPIGEREIMKKRVSVGGN